MIKSKYVLFLLTVCCLNYYGNAHSLNNYLATKNLHLPMDDLSMANSEEINLLHLHLDLNVSFETQSLSGYAEWDISIRSTADKIIFDVEKLDVAKVEIDGKPAKYRILDNPNWHSSGLEVDLKKNTSKVRIYYKTSLGASALQWLTSQQTQSGHPFLYTQSQAILARTWVPCFDKPAVRFTYTASIRTPPGLLALMSAENPQQINDQGIYQFKMEQKIPSYLLALAVGKIGFKALNDRSGIFAELGMLDAIAQEFSTLPKMIDVAESLYGPYRWGRYDVLFLPASFPFGGMENPRLTFATPTIIAGDGSLASLLAHELAHSWSGNLVTNSTWSDFWLNEGFTVYFESRIMEEMYGKEYADMLRVLGWGDLANTLKEMGDTNELTRLELRGQNRDPDEAMTDIAYEKGRLFLDHVERIVGRPKFDKFLTEYFNTYAFGNLSTADFRTYLYKNLVGNDSALAKAINFDVWTKETGLPQTVVAPVSVQFALVDSLRGLIVNNDTSAIMATSLWTTHHWLYFLRGLNVEITQMAQLDLIFQFTNSTNSEIAFEWFMLSIKTDYFRAFGKMELFLSNVGRRKFVKPLYTALANKNEDMKTYAFNLYIANRPKYHSVTVNTLDEILGYKP